MKTEKYTICFESIDTALSTEIIISKKEYNNQIAFLNMQLKNTAENESPASVYETTRENEKVTIIQRRYSVGTGDVYLTKYACKPGYHFK